MNLDLIHSLFGNGVDCVPGSFIHLAIDSIPEIVKYGEDVIEADISGNVAASVFNLFAVDFSVPPVSVCVVIEDVTGLLFLTAYDDLALKLS